MLLFKPDKVQQAQVNADGFFGGMIDDLWLNLTGKHHEPVVALTLDGAGLPVSLRGIRFLPSGHFHFDGADFGEVHPVILRQRKT